MRSFLAAALVLLVGSCTPHGPTGVADRFMDLYFMEFDQQRLLPLTTGLAREKIERELRLVDSIRSQLAPQQVAGARSDMRYRRIEARTEANEARITYGVTIQGAGSRVVMLTLRREAPGWLVGNFTITEGSAPER